MTSFSRLWTLKCVGGDLRMHSAYLEAKEGLQVKLGLNTYHILVISFGKVSSCSVFSFR